MTACDMRLVINLVGNAIEFIVIETGTNVACHMKSSSAVGLGL